MTPMARINRRQGRGFDARSLVRGRADSLIPRPRDGRWQRFLVDCQLERGGHTSGEHERHLVLLDREKDPWTDNVFRQGEKIDGMAIEARSMRGCGHPPRILGFWNDLPLFGGRAIRSRESDPPSSDA